MKFQRPQREEIDLNLAPLIDVVFLLLIFFMVSTTFQRETELSIQLPEATGEPLKNERKVVEITIDAEGRYYVNQQGLVNDRLETLKQAIASAAAGDAKPQVILSIDRRATYEAAVKAMDASRQLGFVHLTFATSQPGEDN